MSVAIGSGFTVRPVSWEEFKVALTTKAAPFQSEDDGNLITVWFYDGPEVFMCTLWKTNIPQVLLDNGFDVEANDDAVREFNTSYRSLANAPVVPKSKDGRVASRTLIANRMTTFKKRVMMLTTSSPSSVHNINPVTGVSYNDTLVRCYDVAGNLLNGNYTFCVKTVIDWEPAYNYEVVGGAVDVPASLINSATSEWFVSAVGVPDLPPEMFGSIDYISETCIEALANNRIESDGRAISYMPYRYGGIPGTNKLRFIIKHPAGQAKRFQFHIDHYV